MENRYYELQILETSQKSLFLKSIHFLMRIVYEKYMWTADHVNIVKKEIILNLYIFTALYLLARNRVKLWSCSNTVKSVLCIFCFFKGTLTGFFFTSSVLNSYFFSVRWWFLNIFLPGHLKIYILYFNPLIAKCQKICSYFIEHAWKSLKGVYWTRLNIANVICEHAWKQ